MKIAQYEAQYEFNKMVKESNEWLDKLSADPPTDTIMFDEYKITKQGKHYTYTRPHQIAYNRLSRS